jgi:mannose-6-phosphate isomerase-like protein (cupin superfamily)
MSLGLYVLPVGGTDKQQPHREDEIYYVVSGGGRMRLRDPEGAERDFAVVPGQVLFVPARQEHRFHSITEELTLLVVFAPAESSE